jgi:hypothetical protein
MKLATPKKTMTTENAAPALGVRRLAAAFLQAAID